jgi:hypothetical protein
MSEPRSTPSSDEPRGGGCQRAPNDEDPDELDAGFRRAVELDGARDERAGDRAAIATRRCLV